MAARALSGPVVAVSLALACASLLSAQVPPPPEGAPMTPALARLMADKEVKAVLAGFLHAEGPLWRPDGYLLFVDSPRSRIHRWDPKTGLALLRQQSFNATALAWDRQGRLLATEHANRRISRTEKDGTIGTLVDRFEGKRLNSPDDLVVATSNTVYFTDPPYGLPRQGEGKELEFQGVYRLHPGGTLTLVVRDLPRPNGVALSPDERTLYVTETESSELLAYPLNAEGAVGTGRVLAMLKPWKSGVIGVADGMTVDEDGRLYVTGPGGVWVFAPNGGRLGVIATPEPPAACAFGGSDGKTLFITARTRVYRASMKVAGLRR